MSIMLYIPIVTVFFKRNSLLKLGTLSQKWLLELTDDRTSRPMGNDRSPEIQRAMACNSIVNSAMWSSFQLVEYFIPVLFIYKFHKDWIKITQAMSRTKLTIVFFGTQGKVTPK